MISNSVSNASITPQKQHKGKRMANKKKKCSDNTIAVNRKARYEFFLEAPLEAGIVLEGWEVKSLRQGRCNLQESYVLIKNEEAWLLGANIAPLSTASTHIEVDPIRTRKLLLNKSELKKLVGSTQRGGYTVVALNMYWKKQRIKLKIALAKGKKLYDKRATEKAKDWSKEQARILKNAR
jgi:SsrA-binding protein